MIKISKQQRVIVFADRMLLSTLTFIDLQMSHLKRYEPKCAGLWRVHPSLEIPGEPILYTDTGQPRRFPPTRAELYRFTMVAPLFHRKVREAQASLLLAHFCENASVGLAISNACKLPFLLYLHGGPEIQGQQTMTERPNLPFIAHRKTVWKRAAGFLCCSDYVRRKAIAAGFPEDRLFTQYLGMDMKRFTVNPEIQRERIVLYVGRMVEYKAADHMIRAMAMMNERLAARGEERFRIVLIGDGIRIRQWKDVDRELNAGAEFLGSQNSATIADWMRRSMLFCGPSRYVEKDGRAEALGQVFLEAQAVGTPVVTYHSGGIPEAVQDGITGLMARDGDFHHLSELLERGLSDREWWTNASAAGPRWVAKNFDVDRHTGLLEERFDEVVQNGFART